MLPVVCVYRCSEWSMVCSCRCIEWSEVCTGVLSGLRCVRVEMGTGVQHVCVQVYCVACGVCVQV